MLLAAGEEALASADAGRTGGVGEGATDAISISTSDGWVLLVAGEALASADAGPTGSIGEGATDAIYVYIRHWEVTARAA